jgi:hypothetical protein
MTAITTLVVNRLACFCQCSIEILFGRHIGQFRIRCRESVDVVIAQLVRDRTHICFGPAGITLSVRGVSTGPLFVPVNVQGIGVDEFGQASDCWDVSPLADTLVAVAVVATLHQ